MTTVLTELNKTSRGTHHRFRYIKKTPILIAYVFEAIFNVFKLSYLSDNPQSTKDETFTCLFYKSVTVKKLKGYRGIHLTIYGSFLL